MQGFISGLWVLFHCSISSTSPDTWSVWNEWPATGLPNVSKTVPLARHSGVKWGVPTNSFPLTLIFFFYRRELSVGHVYLPHGNAIPIGLI